eukprot:TRINITY_DN31043_c0_g1_i2.p1 TRINITY_DN31043_c0_g1~~TRINITY_DN31043_c0_g1_i2.p1  ORF type:complete len:537 (+),score=161.58 TRINITY_DN31043_c0_g1_i2:79-1611(+)
MAAAAAAAPTAAEPPAPAAAAAAPADAATPGAGASAGGAEFEFRDGLRCVVPYWHDFTVHVKGRWVGKTVLDMFCDDFPHQTRDYYEAAIAEGRIRIDGATVPPDHVLRHNQRISHRMRREELPVRDEPPRVLAETERFIAVAKPASLPVHPCGRYAKNTLAHILRTEHGLGAFHPCHRLDRVTSGVLLLARTGKDAERVGRMLRQEDDEEGGAEGGAAAAAGTSSRRVRVRHPIACIDPKKGVMRCVPAGEETPTVAEQVAERDALLQSVRSYAKAKGAAAAAAEPAAAADADAAAPAEAGGGGGRKRKRQLTTAEEKQRKKEAYRRLSDGSAFDARTLPRHAETVFRRLAVVPGTEGPESVVSCHPLTGRTHQIRVHLQSLGHPIVDDWLYNGRDDAKETSDAAATGAGEAATDGDGHALSIMLHAHRYSLTVDGEALSFVAPPPSWAQAAVDAAAQAPAAAGASAAPPPAAAPVAVVAPVAAAAAPVAAAAAPVAADAAAAPDARPA